MNVQAGLGLADETLLHKVCNPTFLSLIFLQLLMHEKATDAYTGQGEVLTGNRHLSVLSVLQTLSSNNGLL